MNVDIAQSVAKNTALQMMQQIITWGSSFVLMMFLPRYLGPVNFGRLYLATSIAAIFFMLVDFDGRIGIAKRIARSPEHDGQTVVNAAGFRVLFWIIAFTGMMTFTLIADYPPIVRILTLIFGIEMLWLGLRSILWGLFLGHEMVNYSTIGNIAERVFISAVGICALLLGINVVGMAIIMVSGTLINFLLCIRYAPRFISSIPKIDLKGTKSMIREGVPYLLWTIFGIVYYRIDSVMLSLLTPEAVVGWYGASYKFFDVLAFLPSIYSLSILPVLSKMWGKEDHMLARTTQKSLEFIMIAGIPISVLIFSLSEQIIKFFFGLHDYTPSIINLQIFAVGLLLVYIDMVLGTALFACDKQRHWAAVAFFAVIVNISLNLLMIPYTQIHFGNGGIGASVATIITEFFVMFSALVIMPKWVLDGSNTLVSLKAIGSGVLMMVGVWYMHKISVIWYIQIVIALGIYGTTLLLLKTFTPQELDFMRNFLSIRNLRSTLTLKKETNV